MYTVGQKVRVRAYGGEILERIVAGENAAQGVLHICSEDEWKHAQNEGREPGCVGFKLRDVLTTDTEEK